MKRLMVLCFLMAFCFAFAHAGISKIKSLKVVVTASIPSSAYIQDKDIKDAVVADLKAKLPKIVLKSDSDIICEVRYSDDYKLSVMGNMYGSYYLAMLIKSEHRDFDKIAPSSRVYWERGVFMPMIDCKTLNASVKDNIGSFVDSFAADWLGDTKTNKK